MKAFKLFNTTGNLCAFEEGTLPELTQIAASYFFLQTRIKNYELHPHPAPRYQFVITVKGKLKFTVSDGSSFILEPGVILVAKDLEGPGHSWTLIEGTEWQRIYIVLPIDVPDNFIRN